MAQSTAFPKAWPSNAVILVAPKKGSEVVDPNEPTVVKVCRDCGWNLAARVSSIQAAENHPQRLGRPIGFLCPECCAGYDPNTITHFTDMRRGQKCSRRSR